MWSKIKVILGAVFGILIGVCGFVLGSRRRGPKGNMGSDRVEGRHTGEDIGRLEQRIEQSEDRIRTSAERQQGLVDQGTQVVGDLRKLLDKVSKDQ